MRMALKVIRDACGLVLLIGGMWLLLIIISADQL